MKAPPLGSALYLALALAFAVAGGCGKGLDEGAAPLAEGGDRDGGDDLGGDDHDGTGDDGTDDAGSDGAADGADGADGADAATDAGGGDDRPLGDEGALDEAPVIAVTDTAVGAEEVVVTFALADAEGDRCSITVEYQGGTAADWRAATVSGATAGLTSGPAHVITWRLIVDEPAQTWTTYKLRLAAHDGTRAGAYAESATFWAGAAPLQAVKLAEARSYDVKDLVFVSNTLGFAVGAPHFDASARAYRSTLLKTQDAGTTWTPAALSIAETLNGVSFTDGLHGWAVGSNGVVLRTSDGGEIWQLAGTGALEDLRAVHFTDATHGFATSTVVTHENPVGEPDRWTGSLWRTTDGGVKWTRQAIPADAAILNGIDFVDAEHGWIAGSKASGEGAPPWSPLAGALYATADGGEHWVEQYSPGLGIVFTAIDMRDAGLGLAGIGWAVGYQHNTVEPKATVYHTADGGQTWTPQSPQVTFADVAFLDTNRGYAVGGDGSPEVWRTKDGGGTWEKIILVDAQGATLRAVAITEVRALAVGDEDFVAESTDPWGPYEFPLHFDLFTTRYLNAHVRYEDVFFTDTERGWVVGSSSAAPSSSRQIVLTTADGGESWQPQLMVGPPESTSAAFRLDRVLFTDADHGFVAGGSGSFPSGSPARRGLLRSTASGGASWADEGAELLLSTDVELFSLTVLPAGDIWALASSRPGSLNVHLAHRPPGVSAFAWVDTGVEGSIGVGSDNVQGDLAFTDALHGWATGGYGIVVHTSDGGQSWSPQSLECGSSSCSSACFAIAAASNDEAWIAGDGIFHTVDGGVSWLPQEIDTDAMLHDIRFTDPLHGYVAGAYGTLAYTRDGGTSWTLAPSGTTQTLRGIAFATPTSGWAVGDNGLILAIRIH